MRDECANDVGFGASNFVFLLQFQKGFSNKSFRDTLAWRFNVPKTKTFPFCFELDKEKSKFDTAQLKNGYFVESLGFPGPGFCN